MSNDTVEEFWTTINGWDRLPRNLFDQYVEQIQEDHAHELAEHIWKESQRRYPSSEVGRPAAYGAGMRMAADLIDLEARPND